MKVRALLFIALGLMIVVFACTHENNETKFKVKKAGACDSNSYSKHVKPIIDLNCANSPICHGAGSFNGDFTTYDLTVPSIPNFRQRVLVDKDMPKSGSLPPDQISIIACWLDNGAKNN